LNGIAVSIGPGAVVIRSDRPMLAVSSAPVGGGLGEVRAIINLHVQKNDPCLNPGRLLAQFADRESVPAPYVGLLTGAWTDGARLATATRYGIEVLAVATVGLSNRMAAGLLPGAVPCAPSTINAILVVGAEAEPAALVNAVITVTEVKARLLGELGVRDVRGRPVTGTSTDAVVVAATGGGPRARFGGPASELGWLVAHTAGQALEAGIRRWIEANP
jgi:adenosylcobinamide hydrolase